MCGISGIINKKDVKVAEKDILAMNDLICHRGPDGEGRYFGENFALGHRRLSIIDLSDNASQPMFWEENLVITYNGEIYNYLEIKDELAAEGYTFRTSSDTEVILAAYDHWGKDCVKHFNGMWSFAIYDQVRNSLFCSRDRFGIKPFYYYSDEEKFVFGSEISQILYFLPQPKVNRNILLDYLIIGFEEHTNETFFDRIFKLGGGQNLIYDLNTHHFEIENFYEIRTDKEISELSETESIERYKEQFEKAVRLRLRSDVKVGTCLSGGLDSSSVAAVASAFYNKNRSEKFTAIHARSSDKVSDESELAELVAKHCGLDLNIVEPSLNDFTSHLDEVIKIQEEPFGSPSVFMQYFVLKKAREIDCTVMLDGQGGDETLLGYEKYYPAYIQSLKGFKKLKGFMDAAENSKLTKKQLLSYFFYFTRYKIRLRRLKKRHAYLKKEVLDNFESSQLRTMSVNYLDILKLQKLEILSTQMPHLLRYEDKNSMANSVETRLPFIDYQTLECALSLNNELKIKKGWTKYILRKAMSNLLPEKIVWRKNKMGFEAPEKSWIDAMEDVMAETVQNSELLNVIVDLERLNYKQLDLRTKWRLFNIARWEKIYNVKAG